ncbi:MAG: hypothetical protein Q9227_008109 [Pyrenula ochraceoflavens]
MLLARRGAERLLFGDALQEEYFRRLFTTDNVPEGNDYEERVKRVASLLGHISLEPGVSGMVPVPDNDRTRSNFRFYCDDDRRYTGHGSVTRWTLRPDPVPPWPRNYARQRNRPLPERAMRGEQFQEWEDRDNEILMGRRQTCQSGAIRAQVYADKIPGPQTSQKEPRATVTLCNFQFKADPPITLDAELRDSLVVASYEVVEDGTVITPLDLATISTSATLLRIMSALPPWSCIDVPSARNPNVPAVYWDRINDLSAENKIMNANNYLFFCLLARLADGGVWLSRDPDEADLGQLERI